MFDLLVDVYDRGLDAVTLMMRDVLSGTEHPSVWMLAFLVVVPAFLFVGRRPRASRRRQRKLHRYRRGHQRQMTFRRHRIWEKEALALLKRIGSGRLSETDTREAIRDMNPYAFEYLIVAIFKQRGLETRKIKRASGDGGIDGMVRIDHRWHLIQAKRYAAPVSAPLVEEFALLSRHKRMPGLFVASSGFTKGAYLAARNGRFIQLLDVHALLTRSVVPV